MFMLETSKLWRNAWNNALTKKVLKVLISNRLSWVKAIVDGLTQPGGAFGVIVLRGKPMIQACLGFWKKKSSTVSPAKHHHTSSSSSSTLHWENYTLKPCTHLFRIWQRLGGWNQKSLDPSDQSRDFHCSSDLSLCLLVQSFLFSCWSSSAEVSLQLFDHKGLIQAVSEQLMLRWFCCLNSVKHLCGL